MKLIKVLVILAPILLVATCWGPTWLWLSTLVLILLGIFALSGYEKWLDKSRHYDKMVPRA